MRDEFLWVEKYRPKTIEDCILPESTKKTFLEFLNKGEVPNLLPSGPAGCGKTTVAKALCNQLGLDSTDILYNVSTIYLPHLINFRFGKLNLINIMGLDEMIIFDFYIRKKNKYKNICDIGANIGFHSLFLKKLNYKNVTSYEPDKQHIKKSNP